MNLETIGARMYRKVTTPVYADDGTYVAGAIEHKDNGDVSVIFIKYQDGKGIVGKGKPSKELVDLLKRYGRELKEYVNQQDEFESRRSDRMTYRQTYRHINSQALPPG